MDQTQNLRDAHTAAQTGYLERIADSIAPARPSVNDIVLNPNTDIPGSSRQIAIQGKVNLIVSTLTQGNVWIYYGSYIFNDPTQPVPSPNRILGPTEISLPIPCAKRFVKIWTIYIPLTSLAAKGTIEIGLT